MIINSIFLLYVRLFVLLKMTLLKPLLKKATAQFSQPPSFRKREPSILISCLG